LALPEEEYLATLGNRGTFFRKTPPTNMPIEKEPISKAKPP
jgi:hypothetical protein